MLTGWRESYETFGLECLRTHSTAIDTGLRDGGSHTKHSDLSVSEHTPQP